MTLSSGQRVVIFWTFCLVSDVFSSRTTCRPKMSSSDIFGWHDLSPDNMTCRSTTCHVARWHVMSSWHDSISDKIDNMSRDFSQKLQHLRKNGRFLNVVSPISAIFGRYFLMSSRLDQNVIRNFMLSQRCRRHVIGNVMLSRHCLWHVVRNVISSRCCASVGGCSTSVLHTSVSYLSHLLTDLYEANIIN